MSQEGCMNAKEFNMEPLIRIISSITMIIYIVIAFVLTLLAVISFSGVGLSIVTLVTSGTFIGGILQVLHALLITIIIIELLETVTAYFRTNRLQIRPILIAGLTAMIRRILLFGIETTEINEIALTLAAIVVLTVAVVYIGRQEECQEGCEKEV